MLLSNRTEAGLCTLGADLNFVQNPQQRSQWRGKVCKGWVLEQGPLPGPMNEVLPTVAPRTP